MPPARQPPYDTSLLGVAVGALHHYGNEVTPGEAFVLSGHAFALNIHPDLCPSAPYCWDYRACVELLRNCRSSGDTVASWSS